MTQTLYINYQLIDTDTRALVGRRESGAEYYFEYSSYLDGDSSSGVIWTTASFTHNPFTEKNSSSA